MKKKIQMVTGKVEEVKDLGEIITGRKANKFAKYPTRKQYEDTLWGMTHVELCEEIMRLGETASCEKSICRKRCLDLWDRAQKPRKITLPDQRSENLDDIIRNK